MGKRRRERNGRTPVRDLVRIVDGRVDFLAEQLDELRRDLQRFVPRENPGYDPSPDQPPAGDLAVLMNAEFGHVRAVLDDLQLRTAGIAESVKPRDVERPEEGRCVAWDDGPGFDPAPDDDDDDEPGWATRYLELEQQIADATVSIAELRTAVYEELAGFNRRLTDLEKSPAQPSDAAGDPWAMLQTAVEALGLYADERYWDGDRCPDLGNLPAVHALRTIDEARAAGASSGKRSRAKREQ